MWELRAYKVLQVMLELQAHKVLLAFKELQAILGPLEPSVPQAFRA